ncbi:response regulator [Marinoscillum furvescens]|nr:response regulator [Marinoscillum furvescens]
MEGAKNTILIVEDDTALCALLTTYLEPVYQVHAVHNSMDAWDWLSAGNFPNLILTDFKMPFVNGMELTENLRTSGLFRDIPIVVLTGSSDPDLEEHAQIWNIERIVAKPFNPEELLETIDQTLNQANHV